MSLLTHGLQTGAIETPAPAARPLPPPTSPAQQPTTSPAPALPSSADWMGSLDARLPLTALTIPGTHNSGATLGGRWVACQSLPIDEQLAAGVRCLDIRLCHRRDSLRVHHNQWGQQLDAHAVLAACRDFLAAHPTESVLLTIKQELSTSPPVRLAAAWARVRAGFADLLHDSRRIPTLGQARGKVVVVSRDPAISGLVHGQWQVHDEWHIPRASAWYQVKWPGVTDHLRRARAARGDARMWSVHASSNGWKLPPVAAAQLVDEALRGHLAELGERPGTPTSQPERNGVVLLDFPSTELLDSLWRRNF